ncbi:MAG: acetate--CoA ligase family protein [Rhodoferax sp.]|nr:acetate--CoA ligase family protein [Rhodoferax sp.]
MFQGADIANFHTPNRRYGPCHAGQLPAQPGRAEQSASGPQADFAPRHRTIKAIISKALAAGHGMLTEPEARRARGLPASRWCRRRRSAPARRQPAEAAPAIGFPVVLKILSDDISQIGCRRRGVESARRGRRARRRSTMLARVKRQQPGAVIQGFTVQTMLQRAHAQELIIGSATDPVFGPVILFGQGGTAVEVMADRAIALPPLNTQLAKALVARTRVSRLLAGWRDTPAVDEAAVHRALVAVSQLLAEVPEIAELDINPLIANFEGAVALDARIKLKAPPACRGSQLRHPTLPVRVRRGFLVRGRARHLRASDSPRGRSAAHGTFAAPRPRRHPHAGVPTADAPWSAPSWRAWCRSTTRAKWPSWHWPRDQTANCKPSVWRAPSLTPTTSRQSLA